MGRPSAIAPLLLDWLRTPGPSGELAAWKVSELATAVDAAWTTVAQQLQTLAEQGLVRYAGRTYAPRGVQPRRWRAVEVVEGVHAVQGVHGVGRAEVADGPSGGEPVDVHGRSRACADASDVLR